MNKIIRKTQPSKVIRVRRNPTALTFNSGSSSLKVGVVRKGGEILMALNCENLGTKESRIQVKVGKEKYTVPAVMPDHKKAVEFALQLVEKHVKTSTLDAVGHRVVQGGKYTQSTRLIDKVNREIKRNFGLAPLHNPPNYEGIRAAANDKTLRKLPQVAIFDTAFHARMPYWAKWLGVPREWRENDGIENYGFHGTSYTYVSRMLKKLLTSSMPEFDFENKGMGMVIAHLGNGCSMAAVNLDEDGNPIGQDTSMGFTPLSGLIMGTRSGCVDPAIVPMQMKQYGLSAEEVITILNKKSGLLGMYGGINGKTGDMRTIREAAQNGDIYAEQVINTAAYRVGLRASGYIGVSRSPLAFAVTGGIGENDGYFQKKIIGFMPGFGWEMEEGGNNMIIAHSTKIKGLRFFVIKTKEELIFAEDAIGVGLEGKPPKKYSFE